jgi:hypothetical protein
MFKIKLFRHFQYWYNLLNCLKLKKNKITLLALIKQESCRLMFTPISVAIFATLIQNLNSYVWL